MDDVGRLGAALDGDEHVTDEGAQWVDRSWAIAHAHGPGGVFANFPDLELNDWATAYHGDNLARLCAAKQTYDPERFFQFPQGIRALGGITKIRRRYPGGVDGDASQGSISSS